MSALLWPIVLTAMSWRLLGRWKATRGCFGVIAALVWSVFILLFLPSPSQVPEAEPAMAWPLATYPLYWACVAWAIIEATAFAQRRMSTTEAALTVFIPVFQKGRDAALLVYCFAILAVAALIGFSVSV